MSASLVHATTNPFASGKPDSCTRSGIQKSSRLQQSETANVRSTLKKVLLSAALIFSILGTCGAILGVGVSIAGLGIAAGSGVGAAGVVPCAFFAGLFAVLTVSGLCLTRYIFRKI